MHAASPGGPLIVARPASSALAIAARRRLLAAGQPVAVRWGARRADGSVPFYMGLVAAAPREGAPAFR